MPPPLLEPPLRVELTPPPPSGVGGEVARLVVTGRGEAYDHWPRGIGVPAEMIADMHQSPLWPTMEATAHAGLRQPHHRLHAPGSAIRAQHSHSRAWQRGSTAQLRNWLQGKTEALPNASARFLPGTWHGVSAEHLAPALAEFFTGR